MASSILDDEYADGILPPNIKDYPDFPGISDPANPTRQLWKKNIDISISPLASRDQPEQEQANASSSARPDALQKQHDRQQANARTEKPLETLYLWELRDMCKAKGLISTGRKNALIVRIRAHQKPIGVPDMQVPTVAMVPSIGSIDIASVAPSIQPITPKLSDIEVPTDVAQHVHSTSPPAPLGVEPLGAADQLSSATATAIAPLLVEALSLIHI